MKWLLVMVENHLELMTKQGYLFKKTAAYRNVCQNRYVIDNIDI